MAWLTKPNIKWFITTSLLLALGLFIILKISTTVVLPAKVVTTAVMEHSKFSLELVQEDLKTYNTLSPEIVSGIVKQMDSSSIKWGVPVGLMHAIFRVESEYRFWIEHDQVNVKVNGKPTTTRAVGLGGVIWEFWSDSLRKNNIAQERSDLFLYNINIEASTAIVRWITNTKLAQRSTNTDNLIDKIISGYYGAYDKVYHTKMQRITSDLWLKRIAKTLFDSTTTNKYKEQNAKHISKGI